MVDERNWYDIYARVLLFEQTLTFEQDLLLIQQNQQKLDSEVVLGADEIIKLF